MGDGAISHDCPQHQGRNIKKKTSMLTAYTPKRKLKLMAKGRLRGKKEIQTSTLVWHANKCINQHGSKACNSCCCSLPRPQRCNGRTAKPTSESSTSIFPVLPPTLLDFHLTYHTIAELACDCPRFLSAA